MENNIKMHFISLNYGMTLCIGFSRLWIGSIGEFRMDTFRLFNELLLPAEII
jgi:hypothetical protein